ncbi:hypothetical protein BFP72_07900 [Reichenbachiella sp. 5M10]|uniref:imelysin family protein n=1 Tax=Reichenbachiella sp. 5M10 TaxID=1889772 RepID=UPI000C57DE3A|nr:imelysin family protein [Reichenbachiella sp. 5M10]PIB35325.1 hypothetical protein BFP72_07900 [Reichenbachiella sp. 5M10]
MKKILWMLALIMGAAACTTDEGNSSDGFDRHAMLSHWADDIIVPSLTDYVGALDALSAQTETFVANPSVANLVALRTAWKASYLMWQAVGMFQIGLAESTDLQGYTNTFPADAASIDELIQTGVYNFELPSRRNQQGFPAIDYLLNGIASDDDSIVMLYTDAGLGANYAKYLLDVVDRLHDLSTAVLKDWEDGFRDDFVSNDGSGKVSAVDKVANDYVYYFEKYVRASKVGNPAGVFSGQKDETIVEAYYQEDFSKALFEAGLNSMQNFFNGKSKSSDQDGDGFASYLLYLSTLKNNEPLEELINLQYDVVRTKSSQLSDSFVEQVETDNVAMLETYDLMQQNVVFLKVDMLSALNIAVDYQDADGD